MARSLLVCASVLGLLAACDALRVSPKLKDITKGSIGRVLSTVGTKMRDELAVRSFRLNVEALSSSLGAEDDAMNYFAVDVLGCAEAVENGMQDLNYTYAPVNVPVVIGQACDYSNVYLNMGGTKESCSKLTTKLTDEFKGEQNYHRWCRAVAVHESEAMKAALEKIESDPEAKKLMETCSAKCPAIGKIIKSAIALEEHMIQMFTPPSEDQTWGEWKKTFQENLNKMDQLHNTMCDARGEAKCTVAGMGKACGQMLRKIHLSANGVARLFDHCDTKAPCAKVCNGVHEKSMDFMDKEMWVFWGGGSKEKDAMCKALPPVEECSRKPECEKYMELTGFSPKDLEKPRKMCDIIESPCYSKLTSKCEKEKVAFYGPEPDPNIHPWKRNSTCAMDVGHSFSDPDAGTKEKCCKAFQEAGDCAERIGCSAVFKSVVKITPTYWHSFSDGIKKQCPAQWNNNFDGVIETTSTTTTTTTSTVKKIAANKTAANATENATKEDKPPE